MEKGIIGAIKDVIQEIMKMLSGKSDDGTDKIVEYLKDICDKLDRIEVKYDALNARMEKLEERNNAVNDFLRDMNDNIERIDARVEEVMSTIPPAYSMSVRIRDQVIMSCEIRFAGGRVFPADGDIL